MEQESLLSLIFYEDDVIKSYNCYYLDEDLIQITLSHDSNLVGSINLNSIQLKSLLTFLEGVKDDYIEIDDVKIKKSFIQNLKPIINLE
jgi:hypothetical protein